LKLHFGNSDVDLQNSDHLERVRRVFAAANGHRMAIVVHMRSSVTRNRPYGAPSANAFLTELLPAVPDVPVQIAHLAGAGSYDDPRVDEAMAVFANAAARKDPRMARVYFEVSGVLGWGNWRERTALVASRLRQLGLERILFGSDGAQRGNSPAKSWASFRELPLSETEFQTVAANVAPYLR
jgi:predicted TIM-barrel fold metal-dependent hydrolase